MLQIISTGAEQSPEITAAEQLAAIIRSGWPWLERDPDARLDILANVQCHGQNPRDIDIVVLAHLPAQPPFQPHFSLGAQNEDEATQHVARIESFCLVIELKSHDPRSVCFKGTSVEVAYTESDGQVSWKSATNQSEAQKYSLKRYLEANVGSAPWISNLIWLSNVDRGGLPRGSSNILPAKFTLNGLLNSALQAMRPRQFGAEFVFSATRTSDPFPIQEAIRFLTTRILPTPLDRCRMDRIAKAPVLLSWFDDSPQKQILLRGRGGTGKTIMLLQLAWRLHQERGRRVLILTYNHALLSDLRRLLTLLGIGDDINIPRFQVMTVHSFIKSILYHLGLLKADDDFISAYEELKDTAIQYIERGAISETDIETVKRRESDSLEFDKIFVDEGQDWPTNEMQLLRRVYGARKFVVADGLEQLVRQDTNCDWLRGLSPDEYDVRLLSKGLRMKRNLAFFANAFAKELGLQDWHVEPNPESTGGRILVVEGDYFSVPGLHRRLIEESRNLGNEPVDLLACVPPSLVTSEAGVRVPNFAGSLSALGQEIWNGVDPDTRAQTYPLFNRQLRVIQYDSCRGLEGWTCLLFGFDDFYEYKKASTASTVVQGDIIIDDADERFSERRAARWMMIPVTRAMDTLVFQVNGQGGKIPGILRRLADGGCADYVEWIRANEGN